MNSKRNSNGIRGYVNTVKEMELESAALEVASKVWRERADERYRKIRNANRRLQRKCASLRTMLNWTQVLLAAWRYTGITAQMKLKQIQCIL